MSDLQGETMPLPYSRYVGTTERTGDLAEYGKLIIKLGKLKNTLEGKGKAPNENNRYKDLLDQKLAIENKTELIKDLPADRFAVSLTISLAENFFGKLQDALKSLQELANQGVAKNSNDYEMAKRQYVDVYDGLMRNVRLLSQHMIKDALTSEQGEQVLRSIFNRGIVGSRAKTTRAESDAFAIYRSLQTLISDETIRLDLAEAKFKQAENAPGIPCYEVSSDGGQYIVFPVVDEVEQGIFDGEEVSTALGLELTSLGETESKTIKPKKALFKKLGWVLEYARSKNIPGVKVVKVRSHINVGE